MDISSIQAQEIVESMKKITEQDINFVDKKGIVIASTDPNRIGNLHGGAVQVLKTNGNVIVHYDGEYIYSKKGINLPIYYEGEIIGVIGITGKEDEVIKFGEIIKKMTEILVKEAIYIKREEYEKKNIQFFFEELVRNKNNIKENQWLLSRAKLYKVDITIPRRMIICRAHNDNITNREYDNIFNKLSDFFCGSNEQNFVIQNGLNFLIVYDGNLEINKEYIENCILTIREEIKCPLYFGISSVKENISELYIAYQECEKAIRSTLHGGDSKIIFYENLNIELIVNSMSLDEKKYFFNKVFGGIDKSLLDEWENLIVFYIENNGSIKKISEEMFIHKNTLQYRLNKIRDITGYDPRELKDLMVLYMAIIVYQEIG